MSNWEGNTGQRIKPRCVLGLQVSWWAGLAHQHEQEDYQEVSPPGEVPSVPGQRDWVCKSNKNLLENITLLNLERQIQGLNKGLFQCVKCVQGNISRQEAVSMIPPLLLKIEPHHKVGTHWENHIESLQIKFIFCCIWNKGFPLSCRSWTCVQLLDQRLHSSLRCSTLTWKCHSQVKTLTLIHIQRHLQLQFAVDWRWRKESSAKVKCQHFPTDQRFYGFSDIFKSSEEVSLRSDQKKV